MQRLSFKESVEKKCFGCNYDPLACGTWREQIACCVDSDCPNYFNRPMPRQCRDGREHNDAEIAKVRDKVDEAEANKSARRRQPWKQLKLSLLDEENPSNDN